MGAPTQSTREPIVEALFAPSLMPFHCSRRAPAHRSHDSIPTAVVMAVDGTSASRARNPSTKRNGQVSARTAPGQRVYEGGIDHQQNSSSR
jgi:hypothetical protein